MVSNRKGYDSTTSQLSSSLDYVRGFFPLIIIFVVMIVTATLYMLNLDVQGADIFLNQTYESYQNTTARVAKRDAKRVLEHLHRIKQKLPLYIKQYVVKDTDAISVTITAKYTVDNQELLNIYYLDSEEYKTIKAELQLKGYDVK